MKKILILCQIILCFGLSNLSFSQEYETGVFRIWLFDNNIRFDNNQSSDNSLNTILEKYGVSTIEQSFPWANRAENRLFYTVKFTGNDIDFINELRSRAKHIMYPPIQFAKSTILYEPADTMWKDGSLWHLEKIQADLAWNIERGNNDTKIAIIDTYFDPEHPDLTSQMLYNYDPSDPELFTIAIMEWFLIIGMVQLLQDLLLGKQLIVIWCNPLVPDMHQSVTIIKLSLFKKMIC